MLQSNQNFQFTITVAIYLGFVYTYPQCYHFSYHLKWVQYSPMMLFTHNVNKIKSVARKNGEIDGTCKQDFRVKEFFNLYNIHVPRTVKLL